MDDGAALCEEASLHDLIGHLDLEFLCLLVVEVCKECGDVAGEHLGSVPRYLALEFVTGEDDYAVIGNDFLRGIGAFDVAARGNSHINDDGRPKTLAVVITILAFSQTLA